MPDRPCRPMPTTLLTSLLLPLVLAAQVLVATPAAEAAKPVVSTPSIVPFGDWAPAACPRPTGEEPAATRRLVVHHTHEPVAHTPAEVLPALALTCKAHTDRGFSTIGYHYVVDPWGTIYQGRGALPDKHGRPPRTQPQGAHVAGSNAGAVGVVFLGDHEDEPPTAAALTSATHLLAWLLQNIGADPDATVATESSGVGTARFTGTFHPPAVAGHSDSNHTACPGEHLRELLGPIRAETRRLLTGAAPAGWDGMAADAPAAAAAEPAKSESKQAPAEKAPAEKAPADKGSADEAAPAEPAAEQAIDVVESTPLALGPLASPVQRLARGLREVGLLSLAERIMGPSQD